MSATEGPPAVGDVPQTRTSALDEQPTFDLDCRYDDPDDPAEVTIFDAEDDTLTAWLTIDENSAVSLDRIR